MLVAAALSAAGCADPYGPSLTNDPGRIVARLRGLDSVLNGRILQTNAALGVRFTPPREPGRLFADSVLGQTFEWNATTGAFAAGSRAGAPAGGVRLLLYAQQFGEPTQPLQEIGAADLTQNGGSNPTLRALLRGAPGEPLAADLIHSGQFGTDAFWMTATGYLQSADKRLDVRARYDADLTVSVQDFDLSLRDGALHVHSRVTTRILGTTVRQDVTYALHASGESITMTGWVTTTPAPGTWTGVSNTADVAIYVNGRLYATLHGTDATIAMRTPEGALLPPGDAGPLASVFSSPGVLQRQLGALFQPAVNVLRGI